MAVTLSNINYPVLKQVTGKFNFDASYPTGGEAVNASLFGLAMLEQLDILTESGYIFESDIAASKLSATVKAYTSAGFTPAGTLTASTNLDLATPAFSGTGLTAAGQVMTTTSLHTMALNQCAGMWLVPATGATPPMLILSNTAVTGAAAVLTVQGAAATDAGAYKIVKSAAQALAGTPVAAAAAAEVANATNLSTVSATFTAWGY